MRYFEAKVLVPFRASSTQTRQFESYVVKLFGGFHRGEPVDGITSRWDEEPMVPYYVGFDQSDTACVSQKLDPVTRAVKHLFAQEAVYCAVTELAAPFIH